MSDVLFSIAALLVTLGLLITFHEYGHYVVARRFGVKVLRFSIGFGRPLWSRRAGPDGTEYVVAALPLGGYVKMLDEREGPVAEAERARAFNNQPLGARAAVVAAGPVFNFVLAVVVYWLMFIVGVDGLRPIVGEVEEGSAAARSGLANGDLVLRVDERQTPTWEAVTIEVLERVLDGEPVTLTVRTPEGDTVVKSLDLTDAPPLKARGNVLSNLGLTPGLPPLDPVIDEVVADSPAAAAGLAPGDRVVTTDGEPIASWYDWVKIVRANPGRPLEVEVLRGGQRIALTLTPKAVDEDGETMGQVGAGPRTPDDFEATWRASLRYGPGEAFLQAMGKTYDMTVLTLRLLGKMVTGQATLANLSGPISIAQYAGQSASIGLGQFLAFLGLVSLSLGVLNLLPVPVLDGGHLLYYLIEFVKGSPVSEDALIWGQKVGIALLVGLMTLALYNDLTRLLGQ